MAPVGSIPERQTMPSSLRNAFHYGTVFMPTVAVFFFVVGVLAFVLTPYGVWPLGWKCVALIVLGLALSLGMAVAMFVSRREVAQRKQAECGLRTTNQILTSLIESSPLAIISMDLDCTVRLWSSSWIS